MCMGYSATFLSIYLLPTPFTLLFIQYRMSSTIHSCVHTFTTISNISIDAVISRTTISTINARTVAVYCFTVRSQNLAISDKWDWSIYRRRINSQLQNIKNLCHTRTHARARAHKHTHTDARTHTHTHTHTHTPVSYTHLRAHET